ncbi:MAG: hypothetical protein ACRD5M_03015 [Candidatus Acidiferrales bacterium]
MIAALILVMSMVALAQFAVAQWRSMWMTIAAQPLSGHLQAATGIAEEAIGANDFDLLVRTSEQVCPSNEGRSVWLREVGIYYDVIRALDGLCGKQVAGLSNWAQTELTACSRYAAAVLDQRLNSNFAFASEVRNF